MSNISENIYIQRLEVSPKPIQSYIETIYSNEKFDLFVEKHSKNNSDYESKADILRNETGLLLLNINNIDQFIDALTDVLSLEPFQIEKTVNEFFESCIPGEIQDILDQRYSDTPLTPTTETKQPETISHTDILNEIENPTPSIKGLGLKLANTGAQNKMSISSTTNDTISSNTSQATTVPTTSFQSSSFENNPTIGGFSLHTPVNPAQKIADKLNQNLQTPSVSIPKEVYIPKKIDPYKEPVE